MIFFLLATLIDVYEKAVLENYSAKTLRFFTIICRKEKEGNRLIKVCKELEKKYPEAEEIRLSFAQGYFIKGNNKKGINILREMIKKSSYPKKDIIEILMDFELYSNALKFIKFYRKKFNSEHFMNEEAGWVYEKKEKYDRAIQEYIKICNRNRNYYYIKRIEKLIPYMKNIKIFDKIKDKTLKERFKLIFALEKGRIVEFKDKKIIKKLAEILFERKEYKKALELFQKINDSTKIGKIYIAQKKFKKARNYIKEGYELAFIYANLSYREKEEKYKDSLEILLNTENISCKEKIKLYFISDQYENIEKIYSSCSKNDTTDYIYLLTLFSKNNYERFMSHALNFLKKYKKNPFNKMVYMLYLASLNNNNEINSVKKLAVYDFKQNYEKIIEESKKMEIKNVIAFSFIIDTFLKIKKYQESLNLIKKIKRETKEASLTQLLLLEEIKIRYKIHKEDPKIKRLYEEIMLLNPKSPYAHFAREYIE